MGYPGLTRYSSLVSSRLPNRVLKHDNNQFYPCDESVKVQLGS